jgi:thioredoxin-dependent peroxiredoxin
VQGQGLRDSARQFEQANCVVLGASFDTSAENLAFAEAQQFGYRLLSDVDRKVGSAYEVVRASDHPYANFPERFSYLIDPTGVIRKSYAVTDVAGHAAAVLADLEKLSG